MKTSDLIVRIPEPCHEDWNKMRVENTGRFCSSCCKTVIDFTGKTDLEIRDILMENSANRVCGHFKATQLNRPIEFRIDLRQIPQNMSLTRKFAVVLLLVFGSVLISCYDHRGKKIDKIKIESNESEYILGAMVVTRQLENRVENKTEVQFEEPMLLGEVEIPEIDSVKTEEVTKNTEEEVKGKVQYDFSDSTAVQNLKKDSLLLTSDSIMNHSESRCESVVSDEEKNVAPVAVENVRGMVSTGTYFVDGVKVTKNRRVENTTSADFAVFPNPGLGWFTATYALKKRADTRLSVFDVAGNLVQTVAVTNQQYEGQYFISIDLSSQPAGIYTVSFICDGELNTRKVVIEK